MSQSSFAKAASSEFSNETIDPTRAASGAQRWRRALAESLGQDPGATLDEPRRMLAMLKIFGSTRRLADLCLKYPVFAGQAFLEGPSQVLAEALLEHIAADRRLQMRGVKQAGFAVLIAAHMPAALVEIGFGTNPSDAAWMKSAKGQTDLAEAIAKATERYLAEYARRGGATLGGR